MRIAIVLLGSLFLLSCEADKTPDESDAIPIQQVSEDTIKSIPDWEIPIYCPELFETGGQSAVSLKPYDPCQPTKENIPPRIAWIPAAVSILPEDWALPVGEQVQFSHNLEEAPAVFIDWTVNGIPGGDSSVGTIDEQGLYAAPAVIPAVNPVTVRATLSSDSRVFNESPVTVTESPSESGFQWGLWTPRVIDASSPAGAVTFEVGFSGYPSLQFRVWDTATRVFRVPPFTGTLLQPVALRTGVYAWRMSVAEVLGDYTDGTVIQDVGGLHCEGCTAWAFGELGRGIEAVFNDSTVPPVTVFPIAGDIQASSHVVNIVVSETNAAPRTDDAAQYFYQHFSDSFDFFAFVMPVDRFDTPSGGGGAIQNAITGIGLDIYDNSAQWGSAGRLQGQVVLFRDAGVDWTDALMMHEIAHRWMVYLQGPPVQSELYGNHWPPAASFSKGIMGGNETYRYDHVSENVYQITCLPAIEVEPLWEYSDIELYLMGLLAPEQVGPHIIFDDPTTADVCGQGTAIVVTIDDIIATYGARSPDYTESQKDFSMATIVLSKDRLLTPHEMAFFNHMVERGERTDLVTSAYDPNVLRRPFYLATGGRATLSTRILP